MDKRIDIIKDTDGNSIVVINNMRFKGRRSVDWNIAGQICMQRQILRALSKR